MKTSTPSPASGPTRLVEVAPLPSSRQARFEALSPEAYASLGSMEGLTTLPLVETAAREARAAPRLRPLLPGWALGVTLTALAYGLHILPIAPFTVRAGDALRHPISAAIIAILLGVIVRNALPLPRSVFVGSKHLVRVVLPVAVVLIAAELNLMAFASLTTAALAVTLACIALAIAVGYWGGRWVGLSKRTALLIGAGTGICGSSAIVAVAPLIDAEDDDLVLSIATVNLFGLLAMLALPAAGALAGLSDAAFGLWAGTSIHAVPQVAAAGAAYSAEAGQIATLVKLVRVAMLAPLVFGLTFIYTARRAAASASGEGGSRAVTVHYARLVPWFVWGFIGLALVNTLGLIPTLQFEPGSLLAGDGAATAISLNAMLAQVGGVALALAMAAIGLEVNLRLLLSVGARALLAGLIATVALAGVSLALVALLL